MPVIKQGSAIILQPSILKHFVIGIVLQKQAYIVVKIVLIINANN